MRNQAIAAAVLMMLPGCAMSPAQIKAFGEGRDSKVGCFHAKGIGWETTTVYTATDSGVVSKGGVSVSEKCEVTFANTKEKQ